jgi:hypothetical protein
MSHALARLLTHTPPQIDHDVIWSEALRASVGARRERGPWGKESPAERMARLRDVVSQELVAFHDKLIVAQYSGQDFEPAHGSKIWDVQIPLTLFPKRDQGFSRVECVVEFAVEEDSPRRFRILRILPGARTRVMASAELAAHLNVSATAKAGLPGTTVAEVGGKVYATADIGPLVYEAYRMCVEAEIVRGTAARWRLDDPHDPRKLGIESHQLSVLLETSDADGPIHAAGYLQAYSTTRWLTSTLGSFWRDFSAAVKSFFERGLPTEAYSEWEDVIP